MNNNMLWILADDHELDELGYVPSFFDERDPRDARKQIAARYVGGWRPMPKFTIDDDGTLRYPDDEPLKPIASSVLHRKEKLFFYDHAWLAIVQLDGSGYEVSRVD